MTDPRLTKLPNEIVLLILENVVDNEYDQHSRSVNKNLYRRTVPYFVGIRHLALVNKRLQILATPFLYQTVEVDKYQIVRLIHTILVKPGLGDYIRSITINKKGYELSPIESCCEGPFCRSQTTSLLWSKTEQDIINNIIKPANLPNYLKNDRSTRIYRYMSCEHALWSHVILLLYTVPNLQSLDLGIVQAVSSSVRPKDGGFVYFLKETLKYVQSNFDTEQTHKLDALKVEPKEEHGNPEATKSQQALKYLPAGLKNLRSLSHHYSFEGKSRIPSQYYPFEYLSCVFLLPNIHKVSIDCAFAHYKDLHKITPASSRVRELILKDALLEKDSFQKLINGVKELHKLVYAGAKQLGSPRDNRYCGPREIIETLKRHEKTLVHLTLIYNWNDALLRPPVPCDIFKSFLNLKYLKTTTGVLTFRKCDIHKHPKHRHLHSLPCTLEHFVIDFKPLNSLRTLRELRALVENRHTLPNLRSLTFTNNEHQHYYEAYKDSTHKPYRSHSQGVCLFEEQGVPELIDACLA